MSFFWGTVGCFGSIWLATLGAGTLGTISFWLGNTLGLLGGKLSVLRDIIVAKLLLSP